MPKKDFNLIVLGAGSAGLSSAYIASAIKAKVALVERKKMGGDCLNTGCVPSKALIRTAKILSYAKRHKDFGIRAMSAEFDFSEVMERVQSVIKKVEPHDSLERYTNLGVECFNGEARILSPHEVQVEGKTYTTQNIIVATGASPLVPSIPGLDQISYLTTDTIWKIRKRPERLLVVGGGPIGSELSQAFSRLGCNVTLIEKFHCILSREDKDVSDRVCKRFLEEGVDLKLNSGLKEFKIVNGKSFAVIEHNGNLDQVMFDQVLLALGRKARSQDLGLEELGVKINPNGTIQVDEYLRTTTHPNIYACGDVAGPYQFTHTAAHQAWYCAVNALFSPFKKFKVDYRVIPWCTFTDPEVARVGLNELEAQDKGIPYEVTRYGIDDLDRAIVDNEDHGLVKILTVPTKDRILGVTIAGYRAADMIIEHIGAIKNGIGLNKILATIHIYPTMSEANKYAAGIWKKDRAPQGILNFLKKFHSWRR